MTITEPQQLVLVVDDDASVRVSLSRLLLSDGYQVRCFASGDELLAGGIPSQPTCLLLDQHLGIEKGTQIHQRLQTAGWNIPTVFLTADWDTHVVVEAMRGGADNYLTKPYDPQELLAVIRSTFKHIHENTQESAWLAGLRQAFLGLTPREQLIVQMVSQGMLNKQIADQLNLALVTVKLHRGRAMKKLGAQNTADVTRIMMQIGG